MTPPRHPLSPPDRVAAPDPPATVKSQREIELEALLEKSERNTVQERREKEEALRKIAEAERKIAEAERKTQKLPLIDFLEHMEETVFPAFLLELDPAKMATQGATKVAGKMYPGRIQPWTDFPRLHEIAFDKFHDTLGGIACFTSPHGIETIAEMLGRGEKRIASETDANTFIYHAIESPAAAVTTEYLRVLHPGEQHELIFQSNANSMLVKGNNGKPSSPTKDLQPDRWAFLVRGRRSEDDHDNILVAEFKAPHKLKLATLRRVMDSMSTRLDTFFSDAIETLAEAPVTSEDSTAPAVRLPGHVFVAQTLCQAYHYMVGAGCEFGYISTGNSLVLLKVDAQPPYTMYYHAAYFAVPSVVNADERRQQNHGLRQAHETATAYLASLCQLAWQNKARSSEWIAAAKLTLSRWPQSQSQPDRTSLASGLDNDTDGPGGGPSSSSGGAGGNGGSGGPSGAGGAGGAGPLSTIVRLPLPSRPSRRDRSPERSRRHGGYESRSVSPTTPPVTRKYVTEPPTLPYCTQACLLSLAKGLPLDVNCPNVSHHRAARIRHGSHAAGDGDHHALTAALLRARLVDQIAAHMDKDCQNLAKRGYYGRNAAMFKLCVTGFGYTLVGKSVLAATRPLLVQEAKVYRAVAHLQGHLIPVCLGLIDLIVPVPLQNCQDVEHMLLLSYAGPDCATENLYVPAGVDLDRECDRTTWDLQRAGVYNDDIREPNVAWNEEVRRVMHFDFDSVDMTCLPEVKEEDPWDISTPGAVLEDGDSDEPVQDGELVKTETTPTVRSPLLDKRDWNELHRGVGNDGNAKKLGSSDANALVDAGTTHDDETQGSPRKRVRTYGNNQ